MRCSPPRNEHGCIEVRSRRGNCFPKERASGWPVGGETMKFQSVLGFLLVVGSVAANAGGPETCNLAVVSRELPRDTKVCDAKTVTELARQGHVYEQNQLGLAAMLVVSPGVDLKTAAQWFQKSAERGYAPAQVNLAVLYVNGWGVE